jgi:hypothetical protein
MSQLTRRTFVIGTVAGAATATSAGLGALAARRLLLNSSPAAPSFHDKARLAFIEEDRRILDLCRAKTMDAVSALKAKYEHPIMGKMDVWDLVEKMAHCIDVTDLELSGVSQLIHVKQALAAMEADKVDDPELFLTALLHDLGKVFLVSGEVPENILCAADRIGEYPLGAVGLENVAYQFGHGELIYSRIKDHVPERVAWCTRYHMVDMNDAKPFMSDRDRLYAETLMRFRHYDADFKSGYWVPKVDLEKYREIIHHYFPKPILF